MDNKPVVAFYPCCGHDFEEPAHILTNFASQVIFCDIKRFEIPAELPLPSTMVVGDVRKVITEVPKFNVLFYRGDSPGEGGSGVFVLGDSFLPAILGKFPEPGGVIITDGSNSRGGNFRRMIRDSGMTKHGYYFRRSAQQPLIDPYGLWIIFANRV